MSGPDTDEQDSLIGEERGPDDARFEAMSQRHRRELHVHCYRMLASFHEAEDAVQETFLRAWRSRERVDGTTARAWLYTIATNVCLDALRKRARQQTEPRSFADLPQLQPYPDRLLDELDQPEEQAVRRETIELAFLAAMQALPARQRGAFLVRDVLGWSAAETAAVMQTSVAATNSALQRARVTMQDRLPERRAEWAAQPGSEIERELLSRFIDAHERCDAAAAIAISAEDIRITMPPAPLLFDGLARLVPLLERAFGPDRDGDWRLLPTMANRMPAAASYLRTPGDDTFRAFKLDVIRVDGGRIAEITTFGHALFDAFGLPAVLARD